MQSGRDMFESQQRRRGVDAVEPAEQPKARPSLAEFVSRRRAKADATAPNNDKTSDNDKTSGAGGAQPPDDAA